MATAAAAVDAGGLAPFQSVTLLRAACSPRWSLNAKTQAVKVYSVVKRSHVGQHSKDNTKYTLITVCGQWLGTSKLHMDMGQFCVM